MPEFAGHISCAPSQAAVNKNTRTNPFGNVDHDDVANLIAISEPHFRQHAGTRYVVDHYRHSRGRFHSRLNLRDRPVNVGCKNSLLQLMAETARYTHADTFKRTV